MCLMSMWGGEVTAGTSEMISVNDPQLCHLEIRLLQCRWNWNYWNHSGILALSLLVLLQRDTPSKYYYYYWVPCIVAASINKVMWDVRDASWGLDRMRQNLVLFLKADFGYLRCGVGVSRLGICVWLMDPLPLKFHFSPTLCWVTLAEGSVRVEINLVAAGKGLQTNSSR